MIRFYTFRGEAQPLGVRWEEGFKDAFEICSIGLPMNSGPFGDDWGGVSGEYGNGFAEGSLTGRSAYAGLVGGHSKQIVR